MSAKALADSSSSSSSSKDDLNDIFAAFESLAAALAG
jgi:hypothetical protein